MHLRDSILSVASVVGTLGDKRLVDMPARPSAGIGVVEVFFAFLTFPDEPSAEIVRVEALSLWRRANSS